METRRARLQDALPPPPAKRQHTRDHLTQTRAWSLAVTASAPLRGRLRLVARDPDFEVVTGYEWLEIDVPDPAHAPMDGIADAVAWLEQARDACVVWHLLASCPGFGGHENPTFWKKLVDAIAQDPDGLRVERREQYESIMSDDDDDSALDHVVQASDAYKFFVDICELPVSFPRFRLKLPSSELCDTAPGAYRAYDAEEDEEEESDEESDDDQEFSNNAKWFEKVVRTFAGVNDTRSRCSSATHAMVRELMPFVDTKRFNAPIAMGVRLTRFYALDGIACSLRRLARTVRDSHLHHANDRRAIQFTAGQLCFPTVEFEELQICTQHAIKHDRDLDLLTDIVETRTVRIPLVELALTDDIEASALTRFIAAVGARQPWNILGQMTLSLQMKAATAEQTGIIFSMLPLAVGGAVGPLRVATRDRVDLDRAMDEAAWTWLAYLVYHPTSAISAFSRLDLAELDVTEDAAAAIASPASAQASLYRLLHGCPDDTAQDVPCGQYAFVNVAANTKVYPRKSWLGRTLDTLQPARHAALHACAVVKSTVQRLADLPNAVCVILPGYGHGWVSKRAVTEFNRVFGGTRLLYGLRLGGGRGSVRALLSIMRPLVRGTQYLDLLGFGLLTAPQLLDILCACPDVTHLRVQHGGELFHDWSALTADYQEQLKGLALEGLMLDCSRSRAFKAPSPAAWKTCLRKLSEFVVETNGAPTQNLVAVKETCDRACSTEYFVWSRLRWRGQGPPTYEACQEKTRELLGTTTNRLAQQSFSYDGHIALLSAIKRAHDANALGRFDHHMVQLIGEFATTDVPRSVWAEQW